MSVSPVARAQTVESRTDIASASKVRTGLIPKTVQPTRTITPARPKGAAQRYQAEGSPAFAERSPTKSLRPRPKVAHCRHREVKAAEAINATPGHKSQLESPENSVLPTHPSLIAKGASTIQATRLPSNRLRPFRAPIKRPVPSSSGLKFRPKPSDSASTPANRTGKAASWGIQAGLPSRNQTSAIATAALPIRARARRNAELADR